MHKGSKTIQATSGLDFFQRTTAYICLESAICYRPSVCLSVRLSVIGANQLKTLKDRIMKYSAYVFVSRNCSEFPRAGVSNKRGVKKTSHFLALTRKRYEIRPKLLLITKRKSHKRFRLTPRSMTLDDLICNNQFDYCRRISLDFADLGGQATTC